MLVPRLRLPTGDRNLLRVEPVQQVRRVSEGEITAGLDPVALHGGRHAILESGPTSGASAAIGDALQRPGLDVLELRTNRDRNVALHQQVWAAATEAVRHAVVAARA